MPLLAAWAAVISVWDFRERRIPNWTLVAAALTGLGLLLVQGHGVTGAGWLASLAGAAIGMLVWLPGWLLRKLGAGDVKLAGCIGGLLGGLAAVEAMLIAAVALGVMSVIASLSFGPSYRLPAAAALSTGFIVRLWAGPLWTG
ncbi:prepilin peptidase [Sinimarinibacterium flocculans]|uniref:Type IV leader peptidase family protein n=1 Tax=Sinimarinibacterium flocculans TaxID=985250 RepID=A0A318ECN3_9GAMM|nr:prepilin peptidase [Sinimarinibacterium flocculans]PXV70241.1 type IV leader peptidase family protein [Sinimarinibacterium flocculans]